VPLTRSVPPGAIRDAVEIEIRTPELDANKVAGSAAFADVASRPSKLSRAARA
jgi:hypothetical protein